MAAGTRPLSVHGRGSCLSPWYVARSWLSPAPPSSRSGWPSRHTQPGPQRAHQEAGHRESPPSGCRSQTRAVLAGPAQPAGGRAVRRARGAAQRRGAPLRKAVAPTLQPPTVAGQRITSDESQRGFEGLDIRDKVFSQGFELEPPDQGLCGGCSGLRPFSWRRPTSRSPCSTLRRISTRLLRSASTSSPACRPFDPADRPFGPFLSDPKCYFDPDTGRWYHTVLEADVDPDTGALSGGANTLVAAEPVAGSVGVLQRIRDRRITRRTARCASVISRCSAPTPPASSSPPPSTTSPRPRARPASSAPSSTPSTSARWRRAAPPTSCIWSWPQLTGSLQPATVPSGRFETAQGGTEYLMGALDCEVPDCSVDPDSLENTIHVWALTHTATLQSPHPDLRLFDRTVKSQVYGQPVPQRQKHGHAPARRSRTTSRYRPWSPTTRA